MVCSPTPSVRLPEQSSLWRTSAAVLLVVTATVMPGLIGCSTPQIEVGSRLEDARDDGTLPEHQSPPPLSAADSPATLVQRAVVAAQRNLSEASLTSVLDELGIEGPLRDDLVAYLLTLDPNRLDPDSAAVHAAAFLIDRHDPTEGLRTASEERLTLLGLALGLGDHGTLSEMLVDAPASRLLHCHHSTEPDLIMTAYATQLLAELGARGFACRPVALAKTGPKPKPY